MTDCLWPAILGDPSRRLYDEITSTETAWPEEAIEWLNTHYWDERVYDDCTPRGRPAADSREDDILFYSDDTLPRSPDPDPDASTDTESDSEDGGYWSADEGIGRWGLNQ